MPVHIGKDKKGKFAQWGGQKKYYFKTEAGKAAAKRKAARQGQAAYAVGYKGKQL